MEEKVNIVALRKDDPVAFDSIYEKYNKRIFWFSFKYLKNKEDAEGVVQEVFLQLWRRRAYIDESQSLNAYLFTISLNVIRKHFRQLLRHRQHMSRLSEVMDLEAESGEAEINYNDTREMLDKIMVDLPPRQKNIFTLSAIEGLSNNEIAEKLNIKKKTVENHLHRAKKTVRQAISSQNLFCLLFVVFFL